MTVLSSVIDDPSRGHLIGRDHVALLDLSTEGWIHGTGKDVRPYLHRMTSNDIESLTDGAGQHGLYLTPNGRIISELWTYRKSAEDFFIQVPEQVKERVLQRFNLFIITDDVTLTDLGAERVLLSLQGPKADTVLESLGATPPAAELAHCEWPFEGASCQLIRHARTGSKGFDLVIPLAAAEAVAETLRKAVEEHGGAGIDSRAFDQLRITSGVPRFGKEISEDVLPQEAYLERTAVSFDKGCYPGQETVAKIKYRGHVNRHLVRFIIEGSTLPEEGAVVRQGEAKVGLLTGAARLPDEERIVGLGYVKRELVEGQNEVEIGAAGAAVKATTAALDG